MSNIEDYRKLINEKFGDINFIEEGHQYFIGDDEYTPVSYIIKEYEIEEDWDKKAEYCAIARGKTKEGLLKEWKLNNLKSTISGTRTHEFGESYTNMLCGHPELICDGNKRQYLKEFNTLIPTYPKEDAIKKFYDELDSDYKPIGAEFKLSTKYIEGARKICGTCDILFWREDDFFNDRCGVVIGDWKTNKSLINEYSRRANKMMLPPMDKFIDEALSHYTLQFNLYRRMLESIGIKIVDMVLVWLKDNGDYEKIYIKKIDNNIIDDIIKKG